MKPPFVRLLLLAAAVPLAGLALDTKVPKDAGPSDFSKTDLYKRIQSSLVDSAGKPAKSDHLAQSRYIFLYYSASW